MMFSEEKAQQCELLATDFKETGSHNIGSDYCRKCKGRLDKDRLCDGNLPKCSNKHGPLDSDRCKMMPFGWYGYKDTLLLPKSCSDRNMYNCREDGDNCMLVGKNKDTCVDNVAKLFSDPTQERATLKYPDYNPTCTTRNGDILPYYDKDGKTTGQCTFVTNHIDGDVKLIPNEGYKRKEMGDCTMLSDDNPTGTTTYTFGPDGHPRNKWNPEVVGGPPYCNKIIKSKLGDKVKNPILPIQFYQDPVDAPGKIIIREPFSIHSSSNNSNNSTKSLNRKAPRQNNSRKKVVYWNPHDNSTYFH